MNSNIIAFRGFLTTILSELIPYLYYDEAPDNTPFPYITYDLQKVNNDWSTKEQYRLEVNLWDKPDNRDTTDLEALADKIDNALNYTTNINNELFITSYIENRGFVKEEEKAIRHIAFNFNVQIYYK